MNPVARFNIDNFKDVLLEIERLGRLEYLHDLEDRMIAEIATLLDDGSEAAKDQLEKIERLINEDLKFKPKNHLLVSALKNSIKGALAAAKFCF